MQAQTVVSVFQPRGIGGPALAGVARVGWGISTRVHAIPEVLTFRHHIGLPASHALPTVL
jgi:hypothetical protein